jgi:hypothetical protein
MNTAPLWFFWGQKHLPFLRFIALLSATQVHSDVRLVRRENPIRPMGLNWVERQDFQEEPEGEDWSSWVSMLPVRCYWLEELAPQLHRMRADDVHTSDMLKWALLATMECTIADMDQIYLRPLPELRSDVQIVRYEGLPLAGFVPVSFMQGRPHQIWRNAYQKALERYDAEVYNSCGAPCLSFDVAGSLDERTANPWPGHLWVNYRKWLFETDAYPALTPATICLEWYGGSNLRLAKPITGPEKLPRVGALQAAVRSVLAKGGLKTP